MSNTESKQQSREYLITDKFVREQHRIWVGVLFLISGVTAVLSWLDGLWLVVTTSVAVMFAIVVNTIRAAGWNPMTWWRAYAGTEVIILPDDPCFKSVNKPQEVLDAMHQWCVDNVARSDYDIVNPYRIHFRRSDHAMLFKMTWGGVTCK